MLELRFILVTYCNSVVEGRGMAGGYCSARTHMEPQKEAITGYSPSKLKR